MEKQEVQKIAKLARLELSSDELEKFGSQLTGILDYIDQLSELDTSGSEPMGQPLIDKLRLEKDEVADSKAITDIINNAPDKKDNFFRVKKVIE